MKRENIYKMCMILSLFIAVSPLFAFFVANIIGYFQGCAPIIRSIVENCNDAIILGSLFSISWYWVISLPLGLVLFGVFYLFYVSAKK
ncbi:hypothetical protein GW846_06005 [Candidatus Gracilibacteria bacterium]|nr:hypothetical protein [Candidatus Gracilibacteria bacterium]